MKRKKKQGLSLLLAICFLVNLSANAYATTENKNKICDKMDAIEIIENKYLEVNSNQTFSISDKAITEIEIETLSSIKSDMNSINAYIEEGILQTNVDTKEITIVSNVNTLMKSNVNLLASGSKFPLDPYVVKYTFKWWGFYADVNGTGAHKLRGDIDKTIAVLAMGGAIGSFASCGLAIGIAAVTVAILTTMRIDCTTAYENKTGVTLKCTGAPTDHPTITGLSLW